jgi:hypothetical protein
MNYILWRISNRVQPLSFDSPDENLAETGPNLIQMREIQNGGHLHVVTAEDIYSIEYADPPQVHDVKTKLVTSQKYFVGV